MKIKIAQFGLGPIGIETLKLAATKPWAEIVGGIDIDPEKVGKPLAEITGDPALRGASVYRSLEELVAKHKPDVIFHTAVSKIRAAYEQVEPMVRQGISVVSSCEELLFPQLREPELAVKLDKACKDGRAHVLGTGVNPGFVLDRLPALLGQVVGPVRHVTARRVVDARTRRLALQRKVGAGLTEDEFLTLVDKEQLGHVGLLESAALCALGVGLDCDDFEEEIVPVIADEDLTGAFAVKKGLVAGIHQTAVGLENGQERVRLELTIALGAEGPGDEVVLDADPKVTLRIDGGVAGDGATANLVVHAAPRIQQADPGVMTVLDLPVGR